VETLRVASLPIKRRKKKPSKIVFFKNLKFTSSILKNYKKVKVITKKKLKLKFSKTYGGIFKRFKMVISNGFNLVLGPKDIFKKYYRRIFSFSVFLIYFKTEKKNEF